jgi:archaellum component FlaC
MSNEDKILGILEQMQGQFGGLQGQFGEMQGQIGEINGRLDRLETGQAKLEAEVAFVKDTALLMEVEHGNQLRALCDGYLNHSDKLNEHSEILGRIERRLDRFDVVQSSHTRKIESFAR